MGQLGSSWNNFRHIQYLNIFPKSVTKIQVSLKPDNTNGHLRWRHTHLYKNILLNLLKTRNILDKICREIQKGILCSITFFFIKSCPLWENVEKIGRARQATDNSIIWRMHFVYWLTKATDLHSEYVILFFFHHDNGYAKAPQCYVIRTVHCLSCNCCCPAL
jgi:hypothetical protein